jgi:hypothetical protein
MFVNFFVPQTGQQVFRHPPADPVFARALLLFARSNPLADAEIASPPKTKSDGSQQHHGKLITYRPLVLLRRPILNKQ